MPLTSPIPGGPPQGPHRPLEEQMDLIIPEKTAKPVPIKKLGFESSSLSRFANWIRQALHL